MIGIFIAILIGLGVVWLLFNLWDSIMVGEDVTYDPIFDAIKCPKCGCYQYEVCYVDPLFNTGKYGRCKACGWTFDLSEDSTQGRFEARGNIPR